MKRALILAGLGLLASQAQAKEPAAKGADPGQSVTISPVALPIVVNGKLANYVFVNLRLELMPNANGAKLRDKEPFFRDALVRAAHRSPFTLASDLTKIDEAKLKTSMMREAQAIAGPGQVRAVVILSQQPKSLRPRPA